VHAQATIQLSDTLPSTCLLVSAPVTAVKVSVSVNKFEQTGQLETVEMETRNGKWKTETVKT